MTMFDMYYAKLCLPQDVSKSLCFLFKACSVPWRAILRSVPLYAILFANLSSGWLSYTAMTTLPQYIQDVLKFSITKVSPDSKVHGTNLGPTWVLSATCGPHVGPMNLLSGSLSGVGMRVTVWWKGWGHSKRNFHRFRAWQIVHYRYVFT